MKKKIFFILLNIIPYILSIVIFYFYVDKYDLYGDEVYHFGTSRAYLETKKTYRWDFVNNKPLIIKNSFNHSKGDRSEYLRMLTFTKFCSFFGKFFGWSELSLRHVPFIFSLLSILIAHLFFLYFNKNNSFIFIFLALFTSSQILISQYIRAYTLLALIIIPIIMLPILWKKLIINFKIKILYFIKLFLLIICTVILFYFLALSLIEKWHLLHIPIILLVVILSIIYFIKPEILVSKKYFIFFILFLVISFIFTAAISSIVSFSNFHEEFQSFSIKYYTKAVIARSLTTMLFIIPLIIINYIRYFFKDNKANNKNYISNYFQYILTITIFCFIVFPFFIRNESISSDQRQIHLYIFIIILCISYILPYKKMINNISKLISKKAVWAYIFFLISLTFFYQIYLVNWTIKNERGSFSKELSGKLSEYSNSVFLVHKVKAQTLYRKLKIENFYKYNISIISVSDGKKQDKERVKEIIDESIKQNKNIYFLDNKSYWKRRFHITFISDILGIKIKNYYIKDLEDYLNEKNRLNEDKFSNFNIMYLIYKSK